VVETEAPESWLAWPFSWRKVVFGPRAHRRWHYTGPLGQPHRHVRWYIRSVDAPNPETLINLWYSFMAWVTGTDPPWMEEAREAAEEALAEGEGGEEQPWKEEEPRESRKSASFPDAFNPQGPRESQHSLTRRSSVAGSSVETSRGDAVLASLGEADSDGASTTSSARSALERYKRLLTATGVIGTYLCWAIFAWCAPWLHVHTTVARADTHRCCALFRFTFVRARRFSRALLLSARA